LTLADCYAAYVDFCSQRGWSALPKNKFSTKIADAVARTYGITDRHDIKDASDKAQRGWKDLELPDKVAQSPSEKAPKFSNNQFPDASDAFSPVEWENFRMNSPTVNISGGASDKNPSELSGLMPLQPLLH
jgi:hypothetical protein